MGASEQRLATASDTSTAAAAAASLAVASPGVAPATGSNIFQGRTWTVVALSSGLYHTRPGRGDGCYVCLPSSHHPRAAAAHHATRTAVGTPRARPVPLPATSCRGGTSTGARITPDVFGACACFADCGTCRMMWRRPRRLVGVMAPGGETRHDGRVEYDGGPKTSHKSGHDLLRPRKTADGGGGKR